MDWQALIDLDKQLLLWFNGSQSLYLDSLVRTLTNALTWIPFYLTLFYVVIKNNENVQKILLVVGSAALCVVIAGTIDDTIVKPTVFWWLVRSRLLTTAMVIWSLTNCWTRLYLGVHYPGDILCGLCWGACAGSLAYWLYLRMASRLSTGMNFTSSHYTKTGYLRSDADVPVSMLVFSLLYALLRAAFA